jgi:preprotein translocase subunit SecB
MQRSPLQLEKYFFNKINLVANPKHCGDSGKVSTTVTCAPKKDDERQWLVTLKVTLDNPEDEKATPPYTGEFEIMGFFRVDKEYPLDKLLALVHINAPAMLYGSVREMIFNLTARGPHSHVSLPTVSFVDNFPVKNTIAGNKTPPSSLKQKVFHRTEKNQ